MSLVLSPCTSFPVKRGHQHLIITRFHLLHRKKNNQNFSSNFNSPPFLKNVITSNSLNKRPRGYMALGETKDEISEPEKKQKAWVHETNVWWFVSMLVLAACAPFVYNKNAVRVAVVLAFFNGFGITLGYHRLLTHRSFKLPKWLEYFFAYCGAHALQRDPIVWVGTHKLHHKHADTEMDPNTPTQGVWLSHIGWYLYNDYVSTKCEEYSNVSELKAQGFYRFLHETYFWHPTALAMLLYLCGGFPYLAWGMGMRITVLHLATYIEAYANHLWGERAWNTPDTSTNNWWVAILCLEEGWHNNHHAFPKSARHGLELWQLDLTWELIKFLEFIGLAMDVMSPTEADKRRMASLGFNQKKKNYQ